MYSTLVRIFFLRRNNCRFFSSPLINIHPCSGSDSYSQFRADYASISPPPPLPYFPLLTAWGDIGKTVYPSLLLGSRQAYTTCSPPLLPNCCATPHARNTCFAFSIPWPESLPPLVVLVHALLISNNLFLQEQSASSCLPWINQPHNGIGTKPKANIYEICTEIAQADYQVSFT